MKRKIVNPDPNHKKRIEMEEKIQEKELKDTVENKDELDRELKYKTKPHKS
ncbi:MAG: hypothetical protein JXA94_00505 [Parachlamydiales bacterium]|nr:hypothetical protein [Parachlamydiales bacterium]